MKKAIVFLVALLVLLLVLLWRDTKTESSQEGDIRPVQSFFDKQKEGLFSFEILRGVERFRFQPSLKLQEGGVLLAEHTVVEKNTGRALREDLQQAIPAWISSAQIHIREIPKEGDLSKYGLEKSEALILRVPSAGEAREIWFGKEVPEIQARYFFIPELKLFGYGKADWVKEFETQGFSWMEKRIFSFSLEDIESILFTRISGKLVLIENVQGEWLVQKKQGDPRFIKTLLEGIVNLQAEQIPVLGILPKTTPAYETIVLRLRGGQSIQMKLYVLEQQKQLAILRVNEDEERLYPISILKLRGLSPSPEGLQLQEKP